MPYCTSCGNEVVRDARFCGDCGTAVVLAPAHAASRSAQATTGSDAAPSSSSSSPSSGHTSAPGSPQPDAPADPPAGPRLRLRLESLHTGAALDARHVRQSAVGALWATAPVITLAVVLLSVLRAALDADDRRHLGGVLDWLHVGTWFSGMALHAPLRAGVDMESSLLDLGVRAEASMTLTLGALSLTMLMVAALVMRTRREERTRPSTGVEQLVVRSLLGGAALGLCWFGLALASRGSVRLTQDLDFGLTFHLALFRTTVAAFFLGSVVSLLARAVARRELLGRQVTVWFEPVVAAVRAVTAVCVVVMLGGIGYLLVQAVKAVGDEPATSTVADGADVVASVVMGLLVLPNLALTAAGWLLGASAVVQGDGVTSGALAEFLDLDELPGYADSFSLLNGDGPAWLLLGLVAAALAVCFAAVRTQLRNAPRALTMADVARWALCGAAVWLVLAWVSGVGVGIDASASGDGSEEFPAIDWSGRAGLSLLGALVAGAFWGAVSAVAARVLTPVAAGTTPRLLAALGGGVPHRLHPAWALRLADASVRLGVTPQPWLAQAADVAVDLRVTPVDVRPGKARRAAAVCGLLVALITASGVGHWVLSTKVYGPGGAVREYLEAVSRGDATAALALTRVRPTEGDLVDSKALREQLAVAPIRDIEITDVNHSEDGETANVGARFRAGGTVIEEDYVVTTTDDGHLLGLIQGWELGDPLAAVEVSADPNAGPLTVSGKELTASDVAVVRVFPGVVPVRQSGGTMMSEASQLVTVESGQTEPVRLSTSMRPEAVEGVKQAVATSLEACLKQTTAEVTGCPQELNVWSTPVGGVRRTTEDDIASEVLVDYEGGALTVDGLVDVKASWLESTFSGVDSEEQESEVDLSDARVTPSGNGFDVQWETFGF